VSDLEVAVAVDELARRGVLDPAIAPRLRRAATGELISAHDELRFLLWAGVALIAAGAGMLVRAHLDALGPVTIALALGAASLGCLVWVWRRAPAFTWGEAPQAGFARDYVLLLGALLAAADLAFIEVKFVALGADWPWHLLIVSAAYAVLALRFDSKTLFSLALTTFAAWRGVSLVRMGHVWDEPVQDPMVVEALLCGVLFLGLGMTCERLRRKPHFEPAASWLGWALIIAALVFRAAEGPHAARYALALTASGAILAVFAWDAGHIGRYALGVGAVGFGVAAAIEGLFDISSASWTAFLLMILLIAGLVLAVVFRAHAAMKVRA
jgi:hypothetical protein